ncbi:MAG: thioredoxin fold domain-containing protein [Planctomycetota bacterium]
MPRIITLAVGALIVSVAAHFLLNAKSAPAVNANLDEASLQSAMVLPMGDLIWETEPDAAFTRSAQTGKPVVMLFTAEWCGPCRRIHEGALKNPAVQQQLMAHFIPLYMDVTETHDSPAQRMSSAYGVRGIPALVVADSAGRQLVKSPGSMDTTNYLRWIKKYSE